MKNAALIRLINSMSKSEKRNFKLFSSKVGTDDKLYVKLFDWIVKYQELDEEKLLSKNIGFKKSQLPNLKNKLLNQLLRSLRELNKDVDEEIQAREEFDFAKVLYGKGEYKLSLQHLQKAKRLAAKTKKLPLIYMALDFEKQIESQHVTGSMSTRATELSQASNEAIRALELTNSLSNLSLLLYGHYLQKGFIKNERDYSILKSFFEKHLPPYNIADLDFQQKLYLYQSYVWYYYMCQNFSYNYRYAKKWVMLYEEYPEMATVDTSGYLKSLHNVLSSLFVANKKRMFHQFYLKLSALKENPSMHFDANEESLHQLFYLIHGINRVFLFADYQTGDRLASLLGEILEQGNHNWDKSRIIVFQYKIACIHFGNEKYEQAILWLHKIINENYGDFKQDVQCFARILSLITHYEMGNDQLINYQIVSTYRFLLKMKELGKVQREIFIFLKRSTGMSRKKLNPEFSELRNKLVIIGQETFERRAFLYLDLISWLDSKLKNIKMVQAIRLNENLVNLY